MSDREIKFRALILSGPDKGQLVQVTEIHFGWMAIRVKGLDVAIHYRNAKGHFKVAPPGCYILEQYTGLKDSTNWENLTEDERTAWVQAGNMPSDWAGREIYEGDIGIFDMPGEPSPPRYVGPIIWDNGFFIVVGKQPWRPKYHLSDTEIDMMRLTLCGDIHNNPELLEVKK